jgi:hypothetical protein
MPESLTEQSKIDTYVIRQICSFFTIEIRHFFRLSENLEKFMTFDSSYLILAPAAWG